MALFRTERLDNGVVLEFVDLSNRYFGDYHRVCVEVRLSVLRPDCEVSLVRVSTLERMGVAGADVLITRTALAEDYLQNAGRYLAHADYPARLIAAEAASRRRLHLIGSRSDVP